MTKKEQEFYNKGRIVGFRDAMKIFGKSVQDIDSQLPNKHPIREFIRGITENFDEKSQEAIVMYAASIRLCGNIEEYREQ